MSFGSSNHSSKYGSDLHSGWEDGHHCSCGHGHYYVTSFHISEVDMMSHFERAFFESVRLGAKGAQRIGNNLETAAKETYRCISAIIQFFEATSTPYQTVSFCEDETVYRTRLLHRRWELNPFEINQVSHDALEVQYRCAECSYVVTYTYEIALGGPTESLGNYIKERRRKHAYSPNEKTLTYSDINREFRKMPTKYKLFTNNCKIWSGKLNERILNRIEELKHEKIMRETFHKTKARRFEMTAEAVPMPYTENYFQAFNSPQLNTRHDLLFHSD